MTGQPGCDKVRLALGVYVVGAIEPAERSIVDKHLSQCTDCQAELAGLAGLPALLGRVPASDVERLADAGTGPAEPPPELLDSLLRLVGTRRRVRKWRTIAAAAAAAVIAVSGGLAGGAAISQAVSGPGAAAAGPPAPTVTPSAAAAPNGYESLQNTDPVTHVTAVVDYAPATWGTSLKVWVSGIKPGMTCEFWVVDKRGQRWQAGGWTEKPGDEGVWYSASSPVSGSKIQGYEIMSAGRVLVTVLAA
jgi:hypothetical protein